MPAVAEKVTDAEQIIVLNKIGIIKKLTDIQNAKYQLVHHMEEPGFLQIELMAKNEDSLERKTKILEQTINFIINNIEQQNKLIQKAKERGIKLNKNIWPSLYNELIVCKEILNRKNSLGSIVEKIEELCLKMRKTAAEIRSEE